MKKYCSQLWKIVLESVLVFLVEDVASATESLVIVNTWELYLRNQDISSTDVKYILSVLATLNMEELSAHDYNFKNTKALVNMVETFIDIN